MNTCDGYTGRAKPAQKNTKKILNGRSLSPLTGISSLGTACNVASVVASGLRHCGLPLRGRSSISLCHNEPSGNQVGDRKVITPMYAILISYMVNYGTNSALLPNADIQNFKKDTKEK